MVWAFYGSFLFHISLLWFSTICFPRNVLLMPLSFRYDICCGLFMRCNKIIVGQWLLSICLCRKLIPESNALVVFAMIVVRKDSHGDRLIFLIDFQANLDIGREHSIVQKIPSNVLKYSGFIAIFFYYLSGSDLIGSLCIWCRWIFIA